MGLSTWKCAQLQTPHSAQLMRGCSESLGWGSSPVLQEMAEKHQPEGVLLVLSRKRSLQLAFREC